MKTALIRAAFSIGVGTVSALAILFGTRYFGMAWSGATAMLLGMLCTFMAMWAVHDDF